MWYSGVKFQTISDGFAFPQITYITKLTILPNNENYSDFRYLRAKRAWMTNTRRDICCAVALLTKMTDKSSVKERYKTIKETNKVFRHLQIN